ncbi:MAG: hypothetical protein HRU38_05850 [Saccharospirillaceae bacterium]|nr:hypothetical protein [Pseudomonadales bacterium]NRB78180.1 hypothetical protein [Saccharospirillaceae bacterium]
MSKNSQFDPPQSELENKSSSNLINKLSKVFKVLLWVYVGLYFLSFIYAVFVILIEVLKPVDPYIGSVITADVCFELFSVWVIAIFILVANVKYLRNHSIDNYFFWMSLFFFALIRVYFDMSSLVNTVNSMIDYGFATAFIYSVLGNVTNLIIYIGMFLFVFKGCKIKWTLEVLNLYKMEKLYFIANSIFVILFFVFTFAGYYGMYNPFEMYGNGLLFIDVVLMKVLFVISLSLLVWFRLNHLNLNRYLLLLLYVPGLNVLFYGFLMIKKSPTDKDFSLNMIKALAVSVLLLIAVVLFVLWGSLETNNGFNSNGLQMLEMFNG